MVIVFFIIISTAATLHTQTTPHHIETAADAARALEPFAGRYAGALFAIGLFGASMLAAGVLPLATAYSISEALGFEKGVSRSFREAPIFIGIFTSLVVVGAVVAMMPGQPLIDALLNMQVINGLLLPVLLIAIMRLINDRDLMGEEHTNGTIYNVAAWLTTIAVSAISVIFIVTKFFPNIFPLANAAR
jgi:Mn2+/Fe2+ NRAMP family transporter